MEDEFISVFIWYVIPRHVFGMRLKRKGDVRGEFQIRNNVSDFRKILKGRRLNITKRKIGNKLYSIIYNDEWLLKHNNIPSIINFENEYQTIYGPAIIAEEDENGFITSLTADDIRNIRSQLVLTRNETRNPFKLKITQVIKTSGNHL